MNPDPNQPIVPPIPPVESEAMPPAPPPPPVSTPPVQSTPTPPPPPPAGVTTAPKVKWGKSQIVGALAVVVVLVAGLAAGIFLSQRNQNVASVPAAVCSPVGAQERYCDTSTGAEVDACHTCGTDNQWANGCANQPSCSNPCGNLSDPTDNTTCNFNPTPTGGAPMCPNDASKPIAKYVKFTCPNGCTQTTEDGVTAWRCYDNRVDSTSQLNLNGVCGQVDVLSGSTDDLFCGYTEYTCGEARCQPSTSTPTPTVPGETPTITPTPTPPPGSAQCQQVTIVKIMRGDTEVATPTLAKIQKGDVVTFRGFATATDAQVTTIDFTLTKNGVAQAVVSKDPTLVSGVYQADYAVTIDQATSYSMTASPTYQ